jgi:hypothetical protein
MYSLFISKFNEVHIQGVPSIAVLNAAAMVVMFRHVQACYEIKLLFSVR